MNICPNCNLPTNICTALGHYRNAMTKLEAGEMEDAVLCFVAALGAESKYYSDLHTARMDLGSNAITSNKTLQ